MSSNSTGVGLGTTTLSGADTGGTLFTTVDGSILTGLTSGIVTLNFVSGDITDASGNVTKMNTSLQIMSKKQCKSFTIFCSDADSVIRAGNLLTISDHQLNHTIHNYDFQQIQITIPDNSTPDENQIAFMASTDPYLNYETSANWHDRGVVTGTSTNSETNYYTKHVGAYEDFMITTYNSGGSNSIDLRTARPFLLRTVSPARSVLPRDPIMRSQQIGNIIFIVRRFQARLPIRTVHFQFITIM